MSWDHEIAEVLVRYATAIDGRDRALLESCFTENLTAEYGEQLGRFQDRAAFVEQFITMLAALGPTLHFISNIVVRAAAGGATARSYTQAVVTLPGDGGVIRTAGIYDDVLAQTEDGWRIAKRVYTAVG